jgi:hypothetical protein
VFLQSTWLRSREAYDAPMRYGYVQVGPEGGSAGGVRRSSGAAALLRPLGSGGPEPGLPDARPPAKTARIPSPLPCPPSPPPQPPTPPPHPQDLIELIGLTKHNARPHWGKNVERTFTHAGHPIRPRYPMFDRLLGLQAKFDPGRVFEPPLFSKVARQEGFSLYPGCALDYACYCSDDAHCNAPSNPLGFKCVPSAAFPELRVCKGPADVDPQLVARYGKDHWVKRTDHTASNKRVRDTVDAVLDAPLVGGAARAGLEGFGKVAAALPG